jgi:hypothetical protein
VKVYPAQYHDEIEGWISDKMGGDWLLFPGNLGIYFALI